MQVKIIAEHSAILLTFIKLHVPFVMKIYVLSILEWPFYTGFTLTIFKMFLGSAVAQW